MCNFLLLSLAAKGKFEGKAGVRAGQCRGKAGQGVQGSKK